MLSSIQTAVVAKNENLFLGLQVLKIRVTMPSLDFKPLLKTVGI